MTLQDAIRTDDGRIVIALNKDLYAKEAISCALEDFSENFSGNITSSQTAYKVELIPKNQISGSLLHIAGMEFCNYALSLMQSG